MDSQELEDRVLDFVRRIRVLAQKLPRTLGNRQDVKRLIRSSGSIGEHLAVAHQATTRRLFVERIKSACEAAGVSRYWLQVLETKNRPELDSERDALSKKCTELIGALGDISEFDMGYLRF